MSLKDTETGKKGIKSIKLINRKDSVGKRIFNSLFRRNSMKLSKSSEDEISNNNRNSVTFTEDFSVSESSIDSLHLLKNQLKKKEVKEETVFETLPDLIHSITNEPEEFYISTDPIFRKSFQTTSVESFETTIVESSEALTFDDNQVFLGDQESIFEDNEWNILTEDPEMDELEMILNQLKMKDQSPIIPPSKSKEKISKSPNNKNKDTKKPSNSEDVNTKSEKEEIVEDKKTSQSSENKVKDYFDAKKKPNITSQKKSIKVIDDQLLKTNDVDAELTNDEKNKKNKSIVRKKNKRKKNQEDMQNSSDKGIKKKKKKKKAIIKTDEPIENLTDVITNNEINKSADITAFSIIPLYQNYPPPPSPLIETQSEPAPLPIKIVKKVTKDFTEHKSLNLSNNGEHWRLIQNGIKLRKVEIDEKNSNKKEKADHCFLSSKNIINNMLNERRKDIVDDSDDSDYSGCDFSEDDSE